MGKEDGKDIPASVARKMNWLVAGMQEVRGRIDSRQIQWDREGCWVRELGRSRILGCDDSESHRHGTVRLEESPGKEYKRTKRDVRTRPEGSSVLRCSGGKDT